MQPYQREFLRFAAAAGVLKFGDFTLKSGRRSPYFFNAGGFDTGERLARLADAYARCIVDAGLVFDVLFGPAYKGIPLAAATSVALVRAGRADIPFAFNRKEAKDHGEGGIIVGRPLAGQVLIIDDVITAGTSVGDSVALIRAAGAEPAGVVIALDRQERGAGERSAVAEVEDRYAVPVLSIVTFDHLIECLDDFALEPGQRTAMRNYRVSHGV